VGVKSITVVNLEPGASQAIKSFLADKGIQRPIRIDLNFNGCCDSSLCLRVDSILDSDLTLESDGLTLIVSPDTARLVGEVTISYVNEAGRKGFRLTSSNPVGEWDGFSLSNIIF